MILMWEEKRVTGKRELEKMSRSRVAGPYQAWDAAVLRPISSLSMGCPTLLQDCAYRPTKICEDGGRSTFALKK